MDRTDAEMITAVYDGDDVLRMFQIFNEYADVSKRLREVKF